MASSVLELYLAATRAADIAALDDLYRRYGYCHSVRLVDATPTCINGHEQMTVLNWFVMRGLALAVEDHSRLAKKADLSGDQDFIDWVGRQRYVSTQGAVFFGHELKP